MTKLESNRYFEPTQLAGMRFMQRGIEGSIVISARVARSHF